MIGIDRDRDRETDRQTYIHTYIHTYIGGKRERERETGRQRFMYPDRQTDVQREHRKGCKETTGHIQSDSMTGREAERKREMERDKDRQTVMKIDTERQGVRDTGRQRYIGQIER